MKILLLFAILPFLLLTATAQAQEKTDNCQSKLEEAQKAYQEGRIYDVHKLLLPLFREKCLSDQQTAYAHALMAEVYLELDQTDSARVHMRRMLETENNYEVPGETSYKFVQMRSGFYTFPNITASVLLGGTYSQVKVLENYRVVQQAREKYRGRPPVYVGLEGSYYPFYNFSITTGIFYSIYGFHYKSDGISNSGDKDVQWTYNFTERITYLEVPLRFNFYFKKPSRESGMPRFSPYLTAGPHFSLLYDAYKDLAWYNKIPADNEELSVGFERNATKDYRSGLTWSMNYGGGLKYNLKRGALSAELRYQHYYSNATNPSRRFSGETSWMMYQFFYLPDDIQLRSLRFTLSYTMFLNHKVKEVKSGSLWKKN